MRKYFIPSRKKNEEGQSLVEFALLLPILLVVVLGIVQFGIILNGQVTVTSAAREGARVGIVGADNNEIKTRVINASKALGLVEITEDDITIGPESIEDDEDREKPDDFPDEIGVIGEELEVTVNGCVKIVVPLYDVFAEIFNDNNDCGSGYFPVNSKAVMRIEQYVED